MKFVKVADLTTQETVLIQNSISLNLTERKCKYFISLHTSFSLLRRHCHAPHVTQSLFPINNRRWRGGMTAHTTSAGRLYRLFGSEVSFHSFFFVVPDFFLSTLLSVWSGFFLLKYIQYSWKVAEGVYLTRN